MRVNIEAERGRKQYTKAQLSERLGITQTTYNNYVKGAPIPSDKLELMADIFDCSVDYLLGLDTVRTA